MMAILIWWIFVVALLTLAPPQSWSPHSTSCCVAAFIVVAPLMQPSPQVQQLVSPRQRRARSSSEDSLVFRRLFFRTDNANDKARTNLGGKIPNRVVDELRSSTDLTLPYSVDTTAMSGSSISSSLTIRLAQERDVDAIAEMCVDEYGTLSSTSGSQIMEYLERRGLYNIVDWTTRLKLLDMSHHAVLVASVPASSGSGITADGNDINNNPQIEEEDEEEIIVGMIEVSLQPVLPNKNPPPYPVPLTLKRIVATIFSRGGAPIQPWIQNLLVLPEYRGNGISKILVAACEAYAQTQWNKVVDKIDNEVANSGRIHLHCDADPETGNIPQQLYLNLGYQMIEEEYSNNVKSSVFVIEGVPLLYLYKDLAV